MDPQAGFRRKPDHRDHRRRQLGQPVYCPPYGIASEVSTNRFQLIRRHVDFVEFQVGGARRGASRSTTVGNNRDARGVVFHVPQQSLLTTVEYGYRTIC